MIDTRHVITEKDEFKKLNPSDPIERRLAVQMIGVGEQIEACMHLANGNVDLEARDQFIRQQTKLMDKFIKLVDAWDRRRGIGTPNVSVGDVNVSDGGQAIVGNVKNEPKRFN